MLISQVECAERTGQTRDEPGTVALYSVGEEIGIAQIGECP